MPDAAPAEDPRIRDTRTWLERAVIGLNLCPFAKAVHVKGLVHYAVCEAADRASVLAAFARELDDLAALDAAVRDTTLLIVPNGFDDFRDFNDFLAPAEPLLRKRGLEGVIQLASFHPRYQFEGTQPDDITNFTNRAPYPTLHLLREESIDRAVAAYPDPSAIYEANMDTLRRLGMRGWQALDVGPKP